MNTAFIRVYCPECGEYVRIEVKVNEKLIELEQIVNCPSCHKDILIQQGK
jgi:endogenous inhibitor of DNA gyrase (YacG/DUF329 family)